MPDISYSNNSNNNVVSPPSSSPDTKTMSGMEDYPVAMAVPMSVPTATAPPAMPAAAAGASVLTEKQIERLTQQGYTRSMAQSLSKTKDAFGLRIWIVDNSGSMQATDGHRLVGDINDHGRPHLVKMVDCSRWDEISECVEYHIRLAGLLHAPTRFRFLNHPGAHVTRSQYLSIAEGGDGSAAAAAAADNQYEIQEAVNQLRQVRPGGCTPLTQHILEIHREISVMAPALRATGQRVSLTIATDGLPTDELGHGGTTQRNEFVEALRLLEGLPCWLVIRLCTDEEDVVSFYNDLDALLELSIDVLDDFTGEAEEVFAENPWLNYSLPIHRMREFGYHDRLFDLIDERPLTKSEVRDFCTLLFGTGSFDGVPDPSVDWTGFAKALTTMAESHPTEWNPLMKRPRPLIDVKKLNRIHSGRWFFW